MSGQIMLLAVMKIILISSQNNQFSIYQDITADTFLHLPELLGLTTEPGNLSPTCDTQLGEVANHILIYQASIHLCVMQHVRAWTCTILMSPLRTLKNLRKLIYVRLSHKVAESKFYVGRSLLPVPCLHPCSHAWNGIQNSRRYHHSDPFLPV